MNTATKTINLFMAVTIPLLLFVLSEPFSNSMIIRMFLSVVLSVPVFISVKRLIRSRTSLRARTELRSLIESLYTSTVSGESFSNAVSSSIKDLVILYGENSQVIRAARSYLHAARLGVSFNERLRSFGCSIDCPEAGLVFDMISASDTIGNNITYVLQQNAEMLTDMITSARDISSELSQKRTEGVIMSLMPFAVTWNLHLCFPGYFSSVWSCSWAHLVFIIILAISVISVAVCIKFNADMNSTFDSVNRKSHGIFMISTARKIIVSRNALTRKLKTLAQIISQKLKSRYFQSGMKDFERINYGDPNNEIQYWVIKFLLIIIILFLITLSCLSGIHPFVCLLSGISIYFAHDHDIHKKSSELQRYRELDYPGFISLLETLISCGINIPQAIDKCAEIYSGINSPVSAEISALSKAVNLGGSVSKILEDYAIRINSPEISAVFLGLSGYHMTGNSDTLSVIKLHRSACWNRARNTARRQAEIVSSKLLLPMLIQFICIAAVSVLPSLISSGII
ncbi:MAG: type II secretion system F family protein [Eubacteriales bacterium]|nr:type II secretion system F family protein [Eubacteriales bacterium]MDD4716558.1 type II secretion system F family protein [Eubacteriales bacterium]